MHPDNQRGYNIQQFYSWIPPLHVHVAVARAAVDFQSLSWELCMKNYMEKKQKNKEEDVEEDVKEGVEEDKEETAWRGAEAEDSVRLFFFFLQELTMTSLWAHKNLFW